MSYEDIVKLHYLGQVSEKGLDAESTMPDHFVRKKEIETILETLAAINNKSLKILEIGCGNGVLLNELHKNGYKYVTGIDFLDEFVKLSQSRGLPYDIRLGDARNLDFESSAYDVVIAERVIINLLKSEDQNKAFSEVRRVIKKNGYFIMFEALEDAWINSNEAREEFGLSKILMASQNRWFKNGELENFINGRFLIINEINKKKLQPKNLLSSHYFMTRVLHAAITNLMTEGTDKRNTHFSRFFSELIPPNGNYAPVQFFCLKAI
jgi:SAM-dependent methyltransferase